VTHPNPDHLPSPIQSNSALQRLSVSISTQKYFSTHSRIKDHPRPMHTKSIFRTHTYICLNTSTPLSHFSYLFPPSSSNAYTLIKIHQSGQHACTHFSLTPYPLASDGLITPSSLAYQINLSFHWALSHPWNWTSFISFYLVSWYPVCS
jgi:hypothetical protein